MKSYRSKHYFLLLIILFFGIINLTGCGGDIEGIAKDEDEEILYDEESIESSKGNLTVNVRDDKSKKPVKNAEVIIAGEVRYTDGEGTVTFQNIEEGGYKLEVKADGFLNYSFDEVIVNENALPFKVDLQSNLNARLDELTAAGDFESVVKLLDTPEKLVEYMISNFQHYVDVYGKPPDQPLIYMPEEFFHKRVGNCMNFAVFGSYILEYHGYEVYTLKTFGRLNEIDPTYGDDIYGHTITVFQDEDGYKYITNVGGPKKFFIYGPFDTLEQVIDSEENRVQSRIIDHGYKHVGSFVQKVDPSSFEDAVEQLNSPEKILNYIARNFEEKHDFAGNALSPQQLFESKKGNDIDFAIFVSYLLDHHGYDVHYLRIEFAIEGRKFNHGIVVYRDDNGKFRSIPVPFAIYMIVSQSYDSVNELIRHQYEEVYSLGFKQEVNVIKYGFLDPGSTNWQPAQWVKFSSE